MPIIKGAEPFLLHGGRRGVLLIHGFTGSPSEMCLLGEFLHGKGYTVLAPRLCGHGTSAADMATTAWPHWYGTVEDAYHLLVGLCTDIYAVGLSMGALLALHAASEYPIKKVVSLSAPVYINDNRLPLLPIYRMFRQYAPKKRRKMTVDAQYSVGYDATPLKSLSSLIKLIRHMDTVFPGVTVPTLIIQSLTEHTVRPHSAQYIYDHLGSKTKKLVWLKKSGHIITLDVEKEQVFQEIDDFLGSE